MNLNDISTQLLFTTVPIWTEDKNGNLVSATAFIYNISSPFEPTKSIPLLVTNNHVVSEAKRILIELTEGKAEKPDCNKRIHAELDVNAFIDFKDETLDIAATPIAPIINQVNEANKTIFFRSVGTELIPTDEILNNLAAMEEIVFIGYPSGLRDDKNGSPLIRRGITSTPVWNDFQGEPAFLIDAGVFPGSSGSPVFILNQGSYSTQDGVVVGSRLLFLGVLTQTMIRNTGGGEVYIGIGKVIRSDAIKSFLDRVVQKILMSQNRNN